MSSHDSGVDVDQIVVKGMVCGFLSGLMYPVAALIVLYINAGEYMASQSPAEGWQWFVSNNAWVPFYGLPLCGVTGVIAGAIIGLTIAAVIRRRIGGNHE